MPAEPVQRQSVPVPGVKAAGSHGAASVVFLESINPGSGDKCLQKQRRFFTKITISFPKKENKCNRYTSHLSNH